MYFLLFYFHRGGVLVAFADDYCASLNSHHSYNSDYAVPEEEDMQEGLKW